MFVYISMSEPLVFHHTFKTSMFFFKILMSSITFLCGPSPCISPSHNAFWVLPGKNPVTRKRIHIDLRGFVRWFTRGSMGSKYPLLVPLIGIWYWYTVCTFKYLYSTYEIKEIDTVMSGWLKVEHGHCQTRKGCKPKDNVVLLLHYSPQIWIGHKMSQTPLQQEMYNALIIYIYTSQCINIWHTFHVSQGQGASKIRFETP